jgi:pimeloyl-ACP methyl ester carboxylesterase
VDVPSVVIVSKRDRLIWAGRQRELADAIPGAKSIEIDVAHNGWLVEPDVVCDAIETALGLVAEQLLPHQEAFGPLQ